MNEYVGEGTTSLMWSTIIYAYIYDERKLVFWSGVSSMKSVVTRTCYGILSRSREFNLLMYKYDVITGQCTVALSEKRFLLIFYNTAVTH